MDFSTRTDAEILTIADPIWDNLAQASNQLDYGKFSKDLAREMLQALPEAELRRQMEESRSKEGQLLPERQFIGCVRHQSGVTVLWKGRLSKVGGESLLALRLDEEDGAIKVFAAWVRS